MYTERKGGYRRMASWNFMPKGNLWTGLGLGLAIVAAPVVIPMMAAAVRPLLKAGLKGGYRVYGKGRQAAGSVRQAVGDISEEARAEVKAQLAESD
jgi:hypothetical protein